ncbi:MAG: PEP/pyruvate-binding domain-containing protein [Patescibacteria group bacterium]
MKIRKINNLNKDDVLIAGGKGASLGELTKAGIAIPPGFVILADSKVEDMEKEIIAAFNELSCDLVAVRSSATVEDGKEDAWAGQLESYLNVPRDSLLEKIKLCQASIFSPRAEYYRNQKGLKSANISIAVVVQKMINSKFSGVAFSVHPVTKEKNQLIIEAGYGLGESIVSGEITPDSYIVSKKPKNVLSVIVNSKSQVLDEQQILELSDIVINIENHFNFPCDVEWTHDGNKFYITQSRPITTLGKKDVLISTPEEWTKDRFFNAFLVEESLVLLLRDKFFLKELGYTYKNGITVKGIGDYLLKSEEDHMKMIKQRVLKPKFNFIHKINRLEQNIKTELSKTGKFSVDDYLKIFKTMSEHLAYYGLAKEEAELIFNSNSSSVEDKMYIEKWRNDKSRWHPHDTLWQKISKETKVHVEEIHNMLLDEVTALLKGEEINLEKIAARKHTVWSLVQKDGLVALYLGDMSPQISKRNMENDLTGQTAYSNGKIVTGIVGEDILVVKKTHPGMIEEIRKAKAVVTDEGGILSHAAIVAREFKVPTIIGTKIATEKFKKGDRVEIDTEAGIVRLANK